MTTLDFIVIGAAGILAGIKAGELLGEGGYWLYCNAGPAIRTVRRGMFLALVFTAYGIDRLCGRYSHPSERRQVRRYLAVLERAWRIEDIRTAAGN